MLHRITEPQVAILLATYNGGRYLRAQLDSLLEQTHTNWTLYWRDDGSTDATLEILADFTAVAGQGRCVCIPTPSGRLGPSGSFLALLRAVRPRLAEDDMVAFVDQDDIWLPGKVARGVAALRDEPLDVPALYCARQILVDAQLRQIGVSDELSRPACFPASLAQNLATGCTVMLNRRAASLVAASQPAPATLHDWWCYLVVTGAGGKLLRDRVATVLYRQHEDNVIGAPRSTLHRATAALRRGPGVFMGMLRQHVAALRDQPHLLAPAARAQVEELDRALRGGFRARLRALRMPGLYRQTWSETLLFRLWFLFG
jgi:glycosyltransferase involved in cell wall biosynthesis